MAVLAGRKNFQAHLVGCHPPVGFYKLRSPGWLAGCSLLAKVPQGGGAGGSGEAEGDGWLSPPVLLPSPDPQLLGALPVPCL